MEKDRKGLCIGSMIIGIISILMFVIQPVILIVSIVGIILGIMGLKTKDGMGMAISGIVMSSIGALAGILVMSTVIGTVAIIDKSVEKNNGNGKSYHYEHSSDDGTNSFEFYIGGGPEDDFEENLEERPGSDDYLL